MPEKRLCETVKSPEQLYEELPGNLKVVDQELATVLQEYGSKLPEIDGEVFAFRFKPGGKDIYVFYQNRQSNDSVCWINTKTRTVELQEGQLIDKLQKTLERGVRRESFNRKKARQDEGPDGLIIEAGGYTILPAARQPE